MKRSLRVYLKLFYVTFWLSAVTFGGGYVIVSFMRKKFTDELGWIPEDEMLNLVAIAQSSPGPVAVNASILVGYRVAGIPGACITVLGSVLPPLILLSVISLFYDAFRQNIVVGAVLKGMQAGVAAVIADVVCSLGGKFFRGRQWLSVLIMCAAFVASYFFSVNVLWIILACGCIGGIQVWINMRRAGKGGSV